MLEMARIAGIFLLGRVRNSVLEVLEMEAIVYYVVRMVEERRVMPGGVLCRRRKSLELTMDSK